MFSEKTKEQPLFLLRLPNLHQTLAAMFKHCKHRDNFSIHKIFSRKFLPGAPFSQNPFLFSSSFFRFISLSLFLLPLTLSISHFIPLPHFSLFPLPPPNPLLLYCSVPPPPINIPVRVKEERELRTPLGVR